MTVRSALQRKKTGRVSLFLSFAMLATVTSAYAAPVLDPANGHTYEFVEQRVTWDAARAAATGAGPSCHLATITSQAEDDFVVNQVLPPSSVEIDIWLGGERKTACSDSSDSPSNWGIWITGEPWLYTNWKSDEPEDCTDNCLAYTATDPGSTLPWQWGGDACSNEDFYVVECEPRASAAPMLSAAGVVVAALLLAASGLWALRRQFPRAS